MKTNLRLLKNLAIPTEHGIWTFWATPALISSAIYPSFGGFFLALAGLAAILLENPISQYASDKRRDKFYPRTILARNIIIAYASVLVLATLLAAFFAGPKFLLVFIGAMPFALYQLYFKIQNKARQLLAEFAGVVAISSLVSAIAIAGESSFISAAVLWIVVVWWGFPAVIYVRAKVLYSHSKEVKRLPAVLLALAAVVIVSILYYFSFLPALVIVAFLILLLRSILGMSFIEFRLEPKYIGIIEMALALTMSLIVIISYKHMLIIV